MTEQQPDLEYEECVAALNAEILRALGVASEYSEDSFKVLPSTSEQYQRIADAETQTAESAQALLDLIQRK